MTGIEIVITDETRRKKQLCQENIKLQQSYIDHEKELEWEKEPKQAEKEMEPIYEYIEKKHWNMVIWI